MYKPYSPKKWNPTDSQKQEIIKLLEHPWFIAICEKAEYEHAEWWKWLLSMLQHLDISKKDDVDTIEKEWMRIEAIVWFLNEVKSIDKKIFSAK